MPEFYVAVIVHGRMPADSAVEALRALNDLIRAGIGPDPDEGEREHGVAIAVGSASGGPGESVLKVNEEYLRLVKEASR